MMTNAHVPLPPWANAKERPLATRPHRGPHRRGVSSILAMMFLVLFSSLAVAMAVVAQGNLRTADSELHVSRAMSAAETGLVFASRRLQAQARRFVVEKGIIDPAYTEQIWIGNYNQATDGQVTVLPPDGYTSTKPLQGLGLAEALAEAHEVDEHTVSVPGDITSPVIDDTYGTLRVPPIAISDESNAPFFRLKYELVEDDALIRVTSQGVDGDITRTLQFDFRLEKKIEFAVISPNRIMIGKNVRIEGPLGSRYGVDPETGQPNADELETDNGDPLVLRSDFYWLDAGLDAKLDTFYQQVVAYDVDGDGRLRPNHPVEGSAVAGNADLVDYDGDEYVDDFDLFLSHFDTNGDQRVCYSTPLASAAGHGSLGEEFSGTDDQLARLIDEAFPDRNGDDVVTPEDRQLGWQDGVIDGRDMYAKVHGELAFAVRRSDWDAANGTSYQTVVQGPVRMEEPDDAPVTFEVSDENLLEITTDMFLDSKTWYEDESSSGLEFGDESTGQVQAGIANGGDYVEPGEETWEDVPYGVHEAGGAPYDWYQRPRYENMTFNNVRIPVGTNAVFENCTFVGVTYVEAAQNNQHENWNLAGAISAEDSNGDGVIDDDEWGYSYEDEDGEIFYAAEHEGDVVEHTRELSNNLRFHNCVFLGSLSGDTPAEYAHWRNKIQMTGNTRFYLDPNDPDIEEHEDPPTASAIQSTLSNISEADREELAKSSILMPGWSIDVGNFNNEVAADPTQTPKVKLQGTIIAGVLDVRGTADVHGTLVMTFRPEPGEGPLYYGGQPDAFNTTIGYFGPSDGDGEGVDPDDATFDGFGEITLRYNPDAKLPDGIPWPLRVDPEPRTYVEGGSI